jgi:hypothetical protein
LLIILAAPLFAHSWRVTDFDDNISIQQDGSAVVHERITLAFDGEWHGIHRFIPVEYPGARGTNYTLFLNVTSVSDGNGVKLKYESSTANGFRDLKIFIPNAVDAARTVEIDYVVRNGLRFFEDHDEFYWNVTGNDWPVPIDHASAHVTFPDTAAGSLRSQAFTGAYGSAERNATAEVNGSAVSFETSYPLPMRGGMTIDVFIPKGILKEPGALTRFLWFIGSNPIVFLPLWTLAVMFTLWWYKGRDPDPGLSVAPMYEPPAGMTPAEAGTLLDDTIHPRDITCTLVDLAVRGYVKIEEVDDQGLVFHHKDYIFHLLSRWQSGEISLRMKASYSRTCLWQRSYAIVQLEESLLHRTPRDPPGHQITAAKKGNVSARSRLSEWLQLVRRSSHRSSFLVAAISLEQRSFRLNRPGNWVRIYFSDPLVALRARDDGQNGARWTHSHRRPGFSGVHEPRGCRPTQAYASKYVRDVSALRHGAGRRTSMGASLRGDRQGSGMSRPVEAQASIQYSSPVPCTAWRRTCIKSSSPPRVPVPADQVGAEAVAEEDFPAAVSGAEEAARSSDLKLCRNPSADGSLKTERPALMKARAVPVDCLGLTKRWSLYVAPSVNSGSRLQLKPDGSTLTRR